MPELDPQPTTTLNPHPVGASAADEETEELAQARRNLLKETKRLSLLAERAVMFPDRATEEERNALASITATGIITDLMDKPQKKGVLHSMRAGANNLLRTQRQSNEGISILARYLNARAQLRR